MAKRGLQDGDDDAESKAQFGQRHVQEGQDVEMGEFEDPWEDDIEEDEEIIEEGEEDQDEEDEDEGMHHENLLMRNARRRRDRGVSAVETDGEGSCPHAGFVYV
jgi:hypothetical protein